MTALSHWVSRDAQRTAFALRVVVPLHDFVRIFEGVYYETALPPHKKK